MIQGAMVQNEAGQELGQAAGTGQSLAGRTGLGIHEFLLIPGQSRKVLDQSKRLDTEADALVPQI